MCEVELRPRGSNSGEKRKGRNARLGEKGGESWITERTWGDSELRVAHILKGGKEEPRWKHSAGKPLKWYMSGLRKAAKTRTLTSIGFVNRSFAE